MAIFDTMKRGKHMKKLLTFVIISILCLSLAACGSEGSTTPASDSSNASVPTSDTPTSTETSGDAAVEVESLFGVYVLAEGEGVSGSDQMFLEATKLQELPGMKIMVIENEASDIKAHFYYYNEEKQVVYTGLQDGNTKISTPYSTIIGIRGNMIVLDGAEWKLDGDRIIREGEEDREVYERSDNIDLTEASFEMYFVGN